MNVHKNARLTPHSRADLVRRILQENQRREAVAGAMGVSARTVAKWVGRFRKEGAAGLGDRSSRPLRLRRPTSATTIEQIERLRRQRFTGRQIAKETGVSVATVSRVLRRLGISRVRDLEPAAPIKRYERAHPGELIHLDIKKLGCFERAGHRATGDRRGSSAARSRGEGPGWEFVHVCIDDASRIAFTMIMADETAFSAVAFLKAAVAYYVSLGIKVQRVMTDNGACYKAFAFRDACKELGLRHIRTKPYTPKTNGKAERFIQTALREWAYAKAYPSSHHRANEMPLWLHRYNWHRPHGGISYQTPISRLASDGNNLLRLHT